MALHGSQKRFDRNDDGRLSALEWSSWYYATYEADREERERSRRNVQAARARRKAALTQLEIGACDILDGLRAYLPEQQLKETLWEMVIHWFSWVLCQKKYYTAKNLSLLDEFCAAYMPGYNIKIQNAKKAGKPLFHEKYQLEESGIGSFWRDSIPRLPRYDPCVLYPNWLQSVLYGISELVEGFTGEGIYEQLGEALESRWEYACVMTPNRAAAEKAVRRWDFPDYYGLRDFLVSQFPQITQRWGWGLEQLREMDEYDILYEIYGDDPDLAIQMWKRMLDTAQDHLQENGDKGAAEHLIQVSMEFLWQGEWPMQPLLQTLKHDEHLARQLFQSASVGMAQESILEACWQYGEQELGQTLLELLRNNPCPHKPIEQEEAWMEEQVAEAAALPEADQEHIVYQYCLVELEGISRPLAYLAGDLPLQVGDDVEVPVGRKNTSRPGRVLQVQEYTRATAPWPPEQTKSVLRKL